MLSTFFSVQGYEVYTAAWGADAVRIAQDVAPHLMVLDIRLPDINGYEVCRQVRQQRRTQDLPIIFLTEKRDRVDRLAGLELGVVDYITKPFDIQELRLRVRNTLQRAGQTSLVNAVTGLPEGAVVDEKLHELALSPAAWALVITRIDGLNEFREHYGFVAADDVLRAVGLMIRNSVREIGSSDDFIGSMAPHIFVIATRADHSEAVRARVVQRLEQSLDYFYPQHKPDPASTKQDPRPLELSVGFVSHRDGPFSSAAALKAAAQDALHQGS